MRSEEHHDCRTIDVESSELLDLEVCRGSNHPFRPVVRPQHSGTRDRRTANIRSSHHRYLQESGRTRAFTMKGAQAILTPVQGHGQTAARLQRDWGLDPETLPFARHIRTHALISLVQKGLLYHEIEHSLNKARRIRAEESSNLHPTNWTTSMAAQDRPRLRCFTSDPKRRRTLSPRMATWTKTKPCAPRRPYHNPADHGHPRWRERNHRKMAILTTSKDER